MGTSRSGITELKDQTNIIEQYLLEIRQLQYIINNCHFILNSLASRPDLQQVHAQETMPLINDYNALISALKELLADHFEWEYETNQPKNFRFWRLFYELDKEDLFY